MGVVLLRKSGDISAITALTRMIGI